MRFGFAPRKPASKQFKVPDAYSRQRAELPSSALPGKDSRPEIVIGFAKLAKKKKQRARVPAAESSVVKMKKSLILLAKNHL